MSPSLLPVTGSTVTELDPVEVVTQVSKLHLRQGFTRPRIRCSGDRIGNLGSFLDEDRREVATLEPGLG